MADMIEQRHVKSLVKHASDPRIGLEAEVVQATHRGRSVMSTFHVYENYRGDQSKAKIHFASCQWCNFGEGIHPEAGDENGRWHGPFNTFEAADDAAYETGRPVKKCKKCKPS